MFGSFLFPLGHFTLDHSRIDPVPSHFVIGASPCISHNNPWYHSSNASGVELLHSGNRHLRIWKHPRNDSRSGSSPTVPAAATIKARITK